MLFQPPNILPIACKHENWQDRVLQYYSVISVLPSSQVRICMRNFIFSLPFIKQLIRFLYNTVLVIFGSDLEHWRISASGKAFNGFECKLAISGRFTNFNSKSFFVMCHNFFSTFQPARPGLANFDYTISNGL